METIAEDQFSALYVILLSLQKNIVVFLKGNLFSCSFLQFSIPDSRMYFESMLSLISATETEACCWM